MHGVKCAFSVKDALEKKEQLSQHGGSRLFGPFSTCSSDTEWLIDNVRSRTHCCFHLLTPPEGYCQCDLFLWPLTGLHDEKGPQKEELDRAVVPVEAQRNFILCQWRSYREERRHTTRWKLLCWGKNDFSRWFIVNMISAWLYFK